MWSRRRRRSVIADPTDRDLVRLHWPADLRDSFDALFAIDDAMADVVAKATNPALAAIKLAWWRDRLEELDTAPPPAEPRLKDAAAHLLPRGIKGAELARLEEGYSALLQESPDTEAALRGGTLLFALAARLIGDDPPLAIEQAGRLYAAGKLQRLGIAPASATVATQIRGIPARYRPLTALAVLARRDLQGKEPEATPGRAFALLRHRWSGRIG